jgi:hypothetical protein
MKRALAVVLVVAVVATAVGSATLTGGPTLVVEDTETGETYFTAPVSNGTVVALEYTHSVEQTRVYDEYTVRGDRLVMTRMEFESYGWGLPARADVANRNGTLVYDPPGALRELYVSPGRIAGHRLHVGDRTVDLVARAGDGTVRIHLARRSPLDWLT